MNNSPENGENVRQVKFGDRYFSFQFQASSVIMGFTANKLQASPYRYEKEQLIVGIPGTHNPGEIDWNRFEGRFTTDEISQGYIRHLEALAKTALPVEQKLAIDRILQKEAAQPPRDILQ